MEGLEHEQSKSLPVTKQMVWEAYQKVRANHGSAGVDKESIEKFDANLTNNLYKLWNRLSSGSYFPPAVKEVEIPKGDGKMRKLGIPTVRDRIAQMVVKNHIEPELDKIFHHNSFGYRPGKSAHQAVEQAKNNCWKHEVVIDLDIQGFFDEIDHELLMKALQRHTKENWVLMYIRRWLTAPVQQKDGTIKERDKGTPQGGVISPLLANLFLHYCFDKWTEINHPTLKFERYADDIIIHCDSIEEAQYVLSQVTERLAECKLQVNPTKTRIVYCRNSKRNYGKYPIVSFDFLGFTYRPRHCKTIETKRSFLGFTPSISNVSIKKINTELRNMKIHRRTQTELSGIANVLNPKIRGWINYYGANRKWEMGKVFLFLNRRLYKWARCKYKLYKNNYTGAINRIKKIFLFNPNLFEHWRHGFTP